MSRLSCVTESPDERRQRWTASPEAVETSVCAPFEWRFEVGAILRHVPDTTTGGILLSFDLVIRGATGIDGTGLPGSVADVGVRGARIGRRYLPSLSHQPVLAGQFESLEGAVGGDQGEAVGQRVHRDR